MCPDRGVQASAVLIFHDPHLADLLHTAHRTTPRADETPQHVAKAVHQYGVNQRLALHEILCRQCCRCGSWKEAFISPA